jgi:hypothetical protein
MKNYLIIIVLVIPTFALKAQNIETSTLRWKIETCLDVNTGTLNTAFDQLISYGNGRIEWRSIQGDLKRTFSILETNGQWLNVAQNGSILFEIESDGRRGTVQFIRSGGTITIQVILLREEGNAEQFTLTASSTTPL